ncbi:sugar transport protein 9 [Nicotiana attenuata]|uniref:Sugar transport protein 9 n=1 Tax=Nicotiana attenuata TaxID=49451 RepID=A0A314LCN9_NICAT|nr:sugar transport protein 9 [Nicotiana attenuata]
MTSPYSLSKIYKCIYCPLSYLMNCGYRLICYRDIADSDPILDIAGICIFDMSADASPHERDVADSDDLFKIGGICIFDMSTDASKHERDVITDSDDIGIFDIGSMCIFNMPRPENEEEVVSEATEIVSISPVDMSSSANEEIVSESVSITPVVSNAALALQLPSDVKSQPRLTSLIASGLLAVFGGLTIGYALNVTGGAVGIEGFMVQFSRRIHVKSVKANTDNFCAYINLWLILFSSIVQLSAIPSVWAARGMMESWGRKPVLVIGSILQLVGSILMFWFPNDVVASIGLTVIGCSVALLNQVIPTILSEINVGKAPKWISLGYNSMVLWGSTGTKVVNMASSHNFRYGWRWSFASSGFLALPLLVLSFFLSETPRFLIKKGSMEEAKASLKTLRKSGVEAELQMLSDMVENEGKGTLSRSPLLLVNIAAQIFQQLSGLDSILFFGPFILQSAGFAYNASFVAPLIAGVIRAGVAGFTYPGYSYFGRRRTLVSACLGMVVAQISLLGLFLLVGDPIFQLSQKSAYVGMAFAIPLIGCYSMFSGPSEWIEESYAEEIRVLGSCWETSISLLMSLIMNPAVLLLRSRPGYSCYLPF